MKSKWQRWEEWFLNLTPIKGILDWSKTHSLPGFSKVPIYNVIAFTFNEIQNDNIATRANSIAFSFFLSLFPIIIFLITLLPYFPLDYDWLASITEYIDRFLPAEGASFINETISDLLSIPRQGLLSVGFILALYFASNGITTMMYGFSKSYHTSFKDRGYFKIKFISIVLTFVLFFSFLISIAFVILGEQTLHQLFDNVWEGQVSKFLIRALNYTTAFILIYSSISLLYKYGIALKKRVSFFSPGAMLATVLSLLSSYFFSFFVNNYGTYNQVYGAIGAMIIVLIWLQINCTVLLIGFELNAAIAVNRDLLKEREKKKSIPGAW